MQNLKHQYIGFCTRPADCDDNALDAARDNHVLVELDPEQEPVEPVYLGVIQFVVFTLGFRI